MQGTCRSGKEDQGRSPQRLTESLWQAHQKPCSVVAITPCIHNVKLFLVRHLTKIKALEPNNDLPYVSPIRDMTVCNMCALFGHHWNDTAWVWKRNEHDGHRSQSYSVCQDVLVVSGVEPKIAC